MIIIVFVFLSTISFSFSAESPVPIENASQIAEEDVELPAGYVENSIKKQIENYRQVYTPISHIKGGNFYTVHVPGLINILKNGFAMIHDYMAAHTEDNNSTDKQILRLKKLYKMALTLEKNQKLTQFNFIMLNFFLAKLIDQFRGADFHPFDKLYREKLIELRISKLDDYNLSDFNSLAFIENNFINTMNDISIFFKNQTFMLNFPYSNKSSWGIDYEKNIHDIKSETFFPISLIYTDKKLSIGYNTYVDEILNPDYGMALCSFDISLKPFQTNAISEHKFGQKKDPHYSNFNNTFRMLWHDAMHFLEQYGLEQSIYGNFKLDLRSEFIRIKNFRDKYDRSSVQYKILTRGLFEMSHEMYGAILFNLRDGETKIYVDYNEIGRLPFLKSNTSTLSLNEFLTNFSYLFENSVNYLNSGRNINTRGSLDYKLNFRDHERILKNLADLEGIPLLPEDFSKLDTTGKLNAVENGYRRFWRDFKNLVRSAQYEAKQ